jgi:hypothetical protein
MKLVADNKGSLTSRDLFRPGAAFDAERQPDGSIRIVEIVQKETPTVTPMQTEEGFLMLPVTLDRKAVAAAIRADLDRQ